MKKRRLAAYDAPPFFTIANYEQMVADALEVNARLAPDIVVLDEAQRIKNWSTRTAQAVKRLRSRYAFVLTGTPIENRFIPLSPRQWASHEGFADQVARLAARRLKAGRRLGEGNSSMKPAQPSSPPHTWSRAPSRSRAGCPSRSRSTTP